MALGACRGLTPISGVEPQGTVRVCTGQRLSEQQESQAADFPLEAPEGGLSASQGSEPSVLQWSMGQTFLTSLADSYGKLLGNRSSIKLYYPKTQLCFKSLKKLTAFPKRRKINSFFMSVGSWERESLHPQGPPPDPKGRSRMLAL